MRFLAAFERFMQNPRVIFIGTLVGDGLLWITVLYFTFHIAAAWFRGSFEVWTK